MPYTVLRQTWSKTAITERPELYFVHLEPQIKILHTSKLLPKYTENNVRPAKRPATLVKEKKGSISEKALLVLAQFAKKHPLMVGMIYFKRREYAPLEYIFHLRED